eukprot:CCRYP_008283-RA/>CCRYP_008283-RA protein AED:0.20 eAED:0.09 QI:0/0/0/1/0/0/2/0/126
MYTNIKTDVALTLISELIRQELHKPQQPSYTEALISAYILFSPTVLSRTGMGIAPAPPWATIFALHEQHFVPKWSNHLIFYKRFIGDIIGIWLPTLTGHRHITLVSILQRPSTMAWSRVDCLSSLH